jgi:ABC-type polysaccharide/polyol phosphate export permease
MQNRNLVIEAGARHRYGLFKTAGLIAKRVYSARGLIWQIYKRDFINANKRSFLGFAWNIISPLALALTWILMNAAGVVRPGSLGVPYPVYALIGLNLWNLFSMFFNMSSQTLSGGKGFINQVSYPHEALMIKQSMQAFSIFFISFIVNLVIITLMGYPPSFWTILMPVMVLPLFFLGSGLGLVFSILGVAGDVEKALLTFFNLFMYSVPVVYAFKTEGFLSVINTYNPLTYLIVFVRDMIIFGHSAYLIPYLWVAGASLILFFICLRVFYVTEMLVIERM